MLSFNLHYVRAGKARKTPASSIIYHRLHTNGMNNKPCVQYHTHTHTHTHTAFQLEHCVYTHQTPVHVIQNRETVTEVSKFYIFGRALNTKTWTKT